MTDTNPITDLKSRLTEQQYEVTQHKGTEAPFSGKYVDYKDDGIYQCVCCGAELFSSDHKYDSKSGWPSFCRWRCSCCPRVMPPIGCRVG